jgi:pimeloyl-ACP methyl ester carboxylesterase
LDVRRRQLDIGRGGGRLAALDLGPADRPVDLVFGHANGLNALTYRSLLAPLASRWRILAYDLRGHGASTLDAIAAGRTDWLDLRDDLLAMLEAERIDGAVLAGHSLGATVSLLAAAASPACAASVVLFEPVVMPPGQRGEPAGSPLVAGARRRRSTFPDRATARAAYRQRATFAAWPGAVLADYVTAGFRDRADGQVTLVATPEWEASNYLAQAHDTLGALRHLHLPLSIYKAERGSTCAYGEADRVADGLDHLRIVTLPGTTHFLPMERPDAFAAVLATALTAAGQ